MHKEFSNRAHLMRGSNDALTIRRSIALIEQRVEGCKRFYPWPALIESFERDIEVLRQRLAQIKK